LTNNDSNAAIEIDAELQVVLAEITAIETIILVLPAGSSKDDVVKKKIKLEYKKFLLENRKESYGVVARLEKELDLTKVTLEFNEIDAFMAAITDRKAAL
jgi:hypothetical protein